MLTFDDNGKAIAIVEGGEYDGEIISINDNNKKKRLDPSDINAKFLVIDEGKMIPLPSMETRQVIYVAGPSGSGKSTYSSMQAQQYRKMNPKNAIYLFSRVDNDVVFDGKFNPPIIRIKIDNSLLTHPIDITKQIKSGCLIIFDDIDTIQDEKLKKAVIKLENDILEIGRHQDIYIICCSHLINGNDKKLSRTMLNEAHTLTFFPKSGSTYQINYCLKNYMGLGKKQIDYILGINSRWVTLGKSCPQYMIWENGVCLL